MAAMRLYVLFIGLYLLHPIIAYNSPIHLKKVQSSCFLSQVEKTVENVLNCYGYGKDEDDILNLPNESREAVGIARNLNRRLQALRRNNDCPRCWMQRAHCICQKIPPSTSQVPGLKRIFLLMHHKEIGMKVDTAKLIMASFPKKCRLVVSGIGSKYQTSMREFMQAMESNTCLVLFPDKTAQTLDEILKTSDATDLIEFDLVVIDGTWIQARKIHSRYVAPSGPKTVKLSQEAVAVLEQPYENSAHQMRRHSITWRQVGTFEATRLFLKDLNGYFPSLSKPAFEKIQNYQDIANEAAKIELGPPRKSSIS